MTVGKWMDVGTTAVGSQRARFGNVNASITHSTIIVIKPFRRLFPGLWGLALPGSGRGVWGERGWPRGVLASCLDGGSSLAVPSWFLFLCPIWLGIAFFVERWIGGRGARVFPLVALLHVPGVSVSPDRGRLMELLKTTIFPGGPGELLVLSFQRLWCPR